MAKGVILMTALPPTEGHAALIRFAAEFMSALPGGKRSDLKVILSKRPGEPGDREFHLEALYSLIRYDNIQDSPNFKIDEYDGPENPIPGQEDEFWHRWERVINYKVQGFPDYIFSSETYGYKLADVLTEGSFARYGERLTCTHIPFNLDRDQNIVRATEVRNDPVKYWHKIIQPVREKYTTSVCIFGQESVGKTTLGKSLAHSVDSPYYSEWARPFLEALKSPEVTVERMHTILYGQAALERSSFHRCDRAFRIYDTDLLSTLGYWDLYVSKQNDMPLSTHILFRDSIMRLWKPKDLYIIPRDNIPFTPDPLRYGGDKRETDTQYWINLCKRYSLCYYVLESSDLEVRNNEAVELITMFLKSQTGFYGYEREK